MRYLNFILAFALLAGLAFAADNLTHVGDSKVCDRYTSIWTLQGWNPGSNAQTKINFTNSNGTTVLACNWIRSGGGTYYSLSFGIYINQNNTIFYDMINQTNVSTSECTNTSLTIGQKTLCNATDFNCTYKLVENCTLSGTQQVSENITLPSAFGSTLFESCPPPYVTNEYFRNGTASNVSLIPHDMTSQLYNCYVNATTTYSTSSKNLTGLNNTTTAHFNFLAVTEVANLTEQFGSATCNLTNGTAMVVYDSAGSSPEATWSWVYMLDYWEVASLRGERRQVTSQPATRYAGSEIKGVYYRIVSVYDGLDNVGQFYHKVKVNYNVTRCTMDNPDAYYSIQPIQINGQAVYYIDFTHGGTDAGLLCNTNDTVTIDIASWKNIYLKNFGVPPDVNNTDINFTVNRQELIFDNVQGVFENATNESSPTDYWFTVSTAYNRDPVPDIVNMTCNMTVGATTYVGVEQRDYNPSGTLMFTHFYFNANDTNSTPTNYTINCSAAGNYIAAGSLTDTGTLKYAHYLTRIFMCKLLDTDKYNPSTIWFKGSQATKSLPTDVVCYVSPDGEWTKVLNYAPDKELLKIFTTNNSGEWALDVNQNLNDAEKLSFPFALPGQYQMLSGGIYFYIINDAIFNDIHSGVNQPFTDGQVFNSKVGRLFIYNYNDSVHYDFGNFSTSAVLSVDMKQIYDFDFSPIAFTILGHNATDTTKYAYVDYNNTVRCSINVYNPANAPVAVEFSLTDDKGRGCDSNVFDMEVLTDNASTGYYTYRQTVEGVGWQGYCNNSYFISNAEKGTKLICVATIIYTENGTATYYVRRAELSMKFDKNATASNETSWDDTGGALGGVFSLGLSWIDDLTAYFMGGVDNALKVILGLFVLIALMPIIYWLAVGFLGNGNNRR